MKSYIIGIAGKRNSGKDTVASMINFIFRQGITKASYQEWLVRKEVHDATVADRIIHFADPLKDVLSIIYNIPREYFNDRKYKDELWYCLESGTFVTDKTVGTEKYNIISINDLYDGNSIADELATYSSINNVIKLRTLMQYFGTYICRDKLNKDIWIRCAVSKIIDKAESRRLCIVPDVRFANEANALRISNDSFYGGVIEVRRNDAGNTDNHDSEIIDFIVDEVIENNGTKMALFYKVLNYVEFIVNKK